MLLTFTVTTSARNELVDITRQVRNAVNRAKITDGELIIHVPHTTAAVTVNENADPDVPRDMLSFLEERIPKNYGFSHAEGNSDAHIKSSLIGCTQHLIIRDGAPLLGTWQGIFFCEFDGPRNRSFYIRLTAN